MIGKGKIFKKSKNLRNIMAAFTTGEEINHTNKSDK